MWNASRFCVSSLRRGHASLLCIVPILVYALREQYYIDETTANTGLFLTFVVEIKRAGGCGEVDGKARSQQPSERLLFISSRYLKSFLGLFPKNRVKLNNSRLA